MASRFIVGASDARDTLFKDAQLFAGAFKGKYAYYLRVMEKLINGTEGYIEKESKRCAVVSHPSYENVHTHFCGNVG